MNRRNVLTGLGGLAISGGALFGSGAFTSVSATRSVEVNVFGDSGNTDGVVDGADEGEEGNIAETITEGAVDVLVNTADSAISVKDPNGNPLTDNSGNDVDGTGLFPSYDSIYSDAYIDTDYVSLVANDVTIVFGAGEGLPPNSSLSFADLFAFVPNTDGADFDVRFESDTSSTDSTLTKVAGTDLTTPDDDSTNDPRVSISGENVGDYSNINNITKKGASVDTGTSDSSNQTLDIHIE
jgi:hypothetical protein